jgi:hypothetical protein
MLRIKANITQVRNRCIVLVDSRIFVFCEFFLCQKYRDLCLTYKFKDNKVTNLVNALQISFSDI